MLQNIEDCEDVTTGITGELIKHNVFYRVFMLGSITKYNNHGTIYKKHEPGKLQMKVEFCGKRYLISFGVEKRFVDTSVSKYDTWRSTHMLQRSEEGNDENPG